MIHRRLPFFATAALTLVTACGDDDAGNGPDAAVPLPDTTAYLATSSYDCTATGPFAAPSRPHAMGCFADPACMSRLVAGHRQANPFAPENSLSALRAAILLGVDIAETDVRFTADGRVVMIHDGDVNRTTNGAGDVNTFTLAELQALTLELEVDDPPGDFSCEHIPTLEEFFAVAAGQIVVELEVKDTAAGVAAAEYLRDNNLYGQAFLLCSNSECAAARAAVPDVPIMTRPQEPAEVAGALDFDPKPILVHIDALSSFLTTEVVDQIHAASAKVYANAFIRGDGPALASGELGAYLQLYEEGLDAIQAEYPHYALQALDRLSPAGEASR